MRFEWKSVECNHLPPMTPAPQTTTRVSFGSAFDSYSLRFSAKAEKLVEIPVDWMHLFDPNELWLVFGVFFVLNACVSKQLP